MRFYPPDAAVPTEYQTQDLQLKVLRPEHVERDYDAFMSSRERLLIWSGGSWPAADFTLEQNMGDMHYHEDRYNARTEFTFTVMSRDETRVEGCIYIDPWGDYLKRTDVTPESLGIGDDEGVLSFWVRDSALERQLDRQLVAGLLDWLAGDEWAFKRVYFRANAGQERDIQLLEEAGLRRKHALDVQGQPRTIYFYAKD